MCDRSFRHTHRQTQQTLKFRQRDAYQDGKTARQTDTHGNTPRQKEGETNKDKRRKSAQGEKAIKKVREEGEKT